MTWFDLVAFGLLALIAWVESVRGFGRALFDLLGGIIAIKLVPAVALPLAGQAAVMTAKGANQAFWIGVVFLLFAGLILLIARLVYQSTLLSLDYFDPILGGVFGCVIGFIVVFFFLHSMQLLYGNSAEGQMLAESLAGQEVLKLRTYHYVVGALHGLGQVN